jgi:hypothetical protein
MDPRVMQLLEEIAANAFITKLIVFAMLGFLVTTRWLDSRRH